WKQSCQKRRGRRVLERDKSARGTKETPELAHCAGCSSACDGRGRSGSAISRAHLHTDYELPRLPIPVEALCFEKHVGDAGGATPGRWALAAKRAGARGLDPAAADRAATVSGGRRARGSGKRLGDCLSAGRLVCIPG